MTQRNSWNGPGTRILDRGRRIRGRRHGPAQICITHSFPTQTFEEYSGVDDCTEENRQIIREILYNTVYTDYDRLIQLCDSLALPEGICLMEKRLIDVALRHGTNDLVVPKWKALFSIFDDFESRLGAPVYSLFPEVVGNTFPMLWGESDQR